MSEAQLRAVDTENERSARMKANRTDRYIQVGEKLNDPFVTGLIYDYKKTTPEIKLLPGFIEGTRDQCALQAQYLYSKIKSNERIAIENKTLPTKPGFVLNYIDDKNNCGDIDSCYISDFNNNTKEIQQVSILAPGSCTIGDHNYIEVFCYFKPVKSGNWKISSGNIKGADKFKLWIKHEKAVYDHLYINADLKSVDDTMTMSMNKNYYYALRIHVIGKFPPDQTKSNLAPFSLLHMFKFNGEIDKDVKLENMFNLILNKDGTIYKPNLVYYGLVKQPVTTKGVQGYKCYFVDPNVLSNFSTTERLKYNCPNFLVRREQVKITLGNILLEYTGKPNTKLISAPNLKYIPPYGDMTSAGGTAQILSGNIPIQQGVKLDAAKWNAAIVKYDKDLKNWKDGKQPRYNSWLNFWGHVGSWWSFNWKKYRDKLRDKANALAKGVTDAANSVKNIALDTWKKALDTLNNAKQAYEKARADRKKMNDIWNTFLAKWNKMNAAQKKANQSTYNKNQADLNKAIGNESKMKLNVDIATKTHADAEVAKNKPQPAPAIPAPEPDDPIAVELQKDFDIYAAALAERQKMMDAYLLLVKQQTQAVEVSVLDTLGFGANAGKPSALLSNSKPTSRDIAVMSAPINVDPKTGERLDTKTPVKMEGFTEGIGEPTAPNQSDYLIPNMVSKIYAPVSTNQTHISVTPKLVQAGNADWQAVETTEFPKSNNFVPEHPGQRYVNLPITLTVDGKPETRLFIKSGKPMLSYVDLGSTEPTLVPLSKTISNALYFKIWDDPPPSKGQKLIPGEIDLKFGDLYVVCGTGIDQLTDTAISNGSLSYARLTCFGFTAPARNTISPNDYWVKTDLVKCSSSRGRPSHTDTITINEPDSNELVSPRGYFLLSFEKKDESDQNYYLHMKFGKSVSESTSTADTHSNTLNGAPILFLLRPITSGMSNNVYQKTTYKDTGLSEARVIPRTFHKMMESSKFVEEDGKYFPSTFMEKNTLGINYKTVTGTKDKLACSNLCGPDPNCHNYFFEKNKNLKDNRCMLDKNATVIPMSTFVSPSTSITSSVLGTKQLQTLANKSTKALYDAYNQKPIQTVDYLGFNTDIIYNDKMIRDDDRYVGWAISSEINDQTTRANNAWTINQLPLDGQPVSGIEGFVEGAVGDSLITSPLQDLPGNVASVNAKQSEYIQKFKAANDYISQYHTAQKDLYGTMDVNNVSTAIDYDSSRDVKGAMFIYKTNDSEYVIPSKFTVKPPDDSTKPITTVEDARQEDLTELLLQQNSLYTIGTLTAATFLMTAIVLARE